jgi:uncharacterized membrane protein
MFITVLVVSLILGIGMGIATDNVRYDYLLIFVLMTSTFIFSIISYINTQASKARYKYEYAKLIKRIAEIDKALEH